MLVLAAKGRLPVVPLKSAIELAGEPHARDDTSLLVMLNISLSFSRKRAASSSTAMGRGSTLICMIGDCLQQGQNVC